MRHRVKKSRFGKMDAHRKAMLSLMAKQLFMYQRIKTTLVRAKEAGRLAEKLITIAKENDLNARRRVFAVVRDEDIVKRLFKDIMPLFSSRKGGYTRIIPLGYRRGDGAELVYLDLTEKVKEEKPVKKEKAKKKASAAEKETSAKKSKEAKDTAAAHTAPAPEISQAVKEEKTVENVKKDRARKEDATRVEKKNFFKKFFRRRSGM